MSESMNQGNESNQRKNSGQATHGKKAVSSDDAKELITGQKGDKPFQEPAHKSWLSLNDDSEPVGGDFMKERPHGCTQKNFR